MDNRKTGSGKQQTFSLFHGFDATSKNTQIIPKGCLSKCKNAEEILEMRKPQLGFP